MDTDPVEEGQGTRRPQHGPDRAGTAEPIRRWALL
jgi:hypothetical protein